MRDLIWTIIILWLVWKIYDAFKSVSKANYKSAHNNKGQFAGKVKIDNFDKTQKKHANPNFGEYTDYEEVK